MNKCRNKLTLALIMFCVFGNIANAAFPTIFGNKATPSTDSIVVETSINPNNSPTTAWVEYSTASNLIYFEETAHNVVGTTGHTRNFSINLVGLSPDTLYYLRIAANNGEETVRSDIFSSRTSPSASIPVAPTPIQTAQPVQSAPVARPVAHSPVATTTTKTVALPTIDLPAQTGKKETTKTAEKIKIEASVSSSSNFLPNSWPNWIAFMIMILSLMILFRKLYVDHRTGHHTTIHEDVHHVSTKVETADHIPDLPV